MQLSRRHMIGDVRKSKHQVDLSYIRQVEAGFQYPRTMMYGFFAKRTDPPSSSLLFWLPASSFLPSPATFPDPLWSPIARSRNFHHASGVGSDEARRRAGLRPPLNLHVRISRMQLLRRHALAGCKKRATSVWTLLASVRLGRAASIRG